MSGFKKKVCVLCSRLCRLTLTLLLLVLAPASCQDRVQGFIGDAVLLPCVYGEEPPWPPSVFWRDKDNGVVLDIINGEPQLKVSEKFRGRVVSFQPLYRKGNFSIIMTKLQATDGGPYECHMPSVDFEHHVLLTVAGEREAAVEVVEVVEGVTPGPSGGGAAAASQPALVTLLLLLPLSSAHTR